MGDNAGKVWNYTTDPPDRILPLKVLVSIFENEDLMCANNNCDKNNNDATSYEGNKSCGIEFYKYVTTMFDENTPAYKLVDRIAAIENINLRELSEKTMLSKISNEDDGSIRIG